MVDRKSTTDQSVLDPGKAMSAVLAMLVAEREERLVGGGDPPKTELILERAGLGPAEIAAVTGKNVEAVRKTLQRARKGA